MAGEFELIRKYFQRPAQQDAAQGVLLGIGDDCALLSPVKGQLAVSVDTLVEGVHFPANAPADMIAERALRTNLSDLAAMGASPRWFTLALTLPESNEEWVANFSRGLFRCADQYGIALIGGDTTRGPLSLTIQVMGEVEPGLALRRDGASPGDFVLVTNTLGDGAAALAAIQSSLEFSSDHSAYLFSRFYQPEPQFRAASAIKGLASSALDISDGLVADLNHICEASDVAAIIDVASIPLSAPLISMEDQKQAVLFALTGGDDYQLCFTLPPEYMPELAMKIARGELDASVIGYVAQGSGVHCELDGQPYAISQQGFQHF